MQVTPRDAFGRRLFLQPLGSVLLSLDGGRFEAASLSLDGEAPSASLRIVAVPATSTHVLLTLKAGGDASDPPRALRLECETKPCSLEASPFPGGVPADELVWRVALGSAAGVQLLLSAE